MMATWTEDIAGELALHLTDEETKASPLPLQTLLRLAWKPVIRHDAAGLYLVPLWKWRYACGCGEKVGPPYCPRCHAQAVGKYE